MHRNIIPSQWGLTVEALGLRRRMTRAEAMLWRELKGRKLLGCGFGRRRRIDRYVVDFYCQELALAIEVDGVAHEDPFTHQYDRERDVRLRLCGVAVLRFTDEEVVHNLDGVLSRIRQSIRYLPWRHAER